MAHYFKQRIVERAPALFQQSLPKIMRNWNISLHTVHIVIGGPSSSGQNTGLGVRQSELCSFSHVKVLSKSFNFSGSMRARCNCAEVCLIRAE